MVVVFSKLQYVDDLSSGDPLAERHPGLRNRDNSIQSKASLHIFVFIRVNLGR